MNILIDIGHPAHVHIFKGIAGALQEKGNKVLFTVREGENECELLSGLGLSYEKIGNKSRSISGKILKLITFTWKILRISQRARSDLYLSHGSMYAGIAAFLRRKAHIALEDTGNMEQLILSKPFSNVILSPDALRIDLGRKHLKYRGFHELFYLSPGCFNADRTVLSLLGLSESDPYVIIRFISWGATHDKGFQGISASRKVELAEMLLKKYRIFISSERELPDKLEKYRFPLSPKWLHHAIYFSEFVITEGATIAAESTLLGVPVLYVNTRESDLIDAHEIYGLLQHVRSEGELRGRVESLMNSPQHKQRVKESRDTILKGMIDCNTFLIWFIENYPESFRIFRENPDYQYNFSLHK